MSLDEALTPSMVSNARYTALTLVTGPKTFTALLYGFEAAAVLMSAYVLVRLAVNMKSKKPQDVLTFAGLLPVALLGVLDMLGALQIILLDEITGKGFVTPVGMVFMAFCDCFYPNTS